MRQINLQQPNSGNTTFTQGAIPEDELEHVIGGLARVWVEQLGPAQARPETAVGNPPWDPTATRVET